LVVTETVVVANQAHFENSRGNPKEYMGFPFAIETAAIGDGAQSTEPSLKVRGEAAIFGKPSEFVKFGEYFNLMHAGAFTETLANDDQVQLYQHNTEKPLARKSAGTLALAETPSGLYIASDMAPTSYGKDAAISIARGDIKQQSFGFDIVKSAWRYVKETDQLFRDIFKVKLYEVSPVTFPLFAGTSIETYSREQTLKQIESEAAQARASLIGPPPVVFDFGRHIEFRERNAKLLQQEAMQWRT
jgi:HK97 family phage prohead protease